MAKSDRTVLVGDSGQRNPSWNIRLEWHQVIVAADIFQHTLKLGRQPRVALFIIGGIGQANVAV